MKLDDNILYQDNESIIQMEHNIKMLCTKSTKHIKITYFYITDKLKSGEVTIEHFPTKEMIGDYFIKPIAGLFFKKFQNITYKVSMMAIIPSTGIHTTSHQKTALCKRTSDCQEGKAHCQHVKLPSRSVLEIKYHQLLGLLWYGGIRTEKMLSCLRRRMKTDSKLNE